MAEKMALAVQDLATQRVFLERARAEDWDHVAIPQPVDWPTINTFLDSRPGRYFTFSKANDFADWKKMGQRMYKTYSQFFYFSDKKTAFEFKMNFG